MDGGRWICARALHILRRQTDGRLPCFWLIYRTERGPGPRRGSPAGVVDAPDASGYSSYDLYVERFMFKVNSGIRRYRARFFNVLDGNASSN